MKKLDLATHKVVPGYGVRTAQLRKLINGLKPNDAIPFGDVIAEFNLSERHLQHILRDMKATVRIVIDDKLVTCVVHPKTAAKYNATEKNNATK